MVIGPSPEASPKGERHLSVQHTPDGKTVPHHGAESDCIRFCCSVTITVSTVSIPMMPVGTQCIC